MTFETTDELLNEVKSSGMSAQDKSFIVDFAHNLLSAVVRDLSTSLNAIMSDGAAAQYVVDSHAEYVRRLSQAANQERENRDRNILVVTNVPGHDSDSKDLRILLRCDNVTKIEMFKAAIERNMPSAYQVFHIVNRVDHQRFDFWKPSVPHVLDVATEIAKELGIGKSFRIIGPRNGDRGDAPPYIPFDPETHVFDDFTA